METLVSPSHPRFSRSGALATPHFNSNSPRKRRKYIPGGPGGGGRWVEERAANMVPTLNTRSSAISRMRSARTPARTVRPRRQTPVEKPTFDSAADAAAAAVQIDGYKPREERSWEEFHPNLELDTALTVFPANEVDGVLEEQKSSQDGSVRVSDDAGVLVLQSTPTTPVKRRPGRPPRRPESMLNGLGSPPAQKIVPLPAHNPRERLTLPKPSYREVRTFDSFEVDKKAQENYVDRTMKKVGYQESEKFEKPRNLIRYDEHALDMDSQGGPRTNPDTEAIENISLAPAVFLVEYDMDEQDEQWLEAHNVHRKEQEQVDAIKPAVFEFTMTLIEQEWHALEKRIPKPNPKPPQTQRPRSSSSAAVNGEPAASGEEQDSKCAICDDGDCENTNAIVFCDGCDLAVHQECYGVPFIPEGQWLCRKCQQVGRATPTCIFCPNTDGAFKLTTESRWAHLLCAIWIPEVTLGNQTFMEPIMEVAAVPKQRWKLTCYICNQKMGACIQCGNKNCYQAFHVTCARKAKLFLKMKSAHGGPAALDASVLKAFCDKHVPPEWSSEHDVETATAEAKAYYRFEMRGRKWADSQQSAMALVTSQPSQPTDLVHDLNVYDGASAMTVGNGPKKRQLQPPKNVWRLPSGAPVVPQVVATAVEEGLIRFNPRKRKEFVAEICKYWTLKREARRGAALLKRLQLQMETFSTAEITRRDFSAMGGAGRVRLERRIAFAEQLEQEMLTLRTLCEAVKQREEVKLKDVELLTGVVDIIYSPISALLWPIIEKAKKLSQPQTLEKPADSTEVGRKMFSDTFDSLQENLERRKYGSVQMFSVDLGHLFRLVAGLELVNDGFEAHNVLSTSSFRDESMTPDQKETKKLAKRIMKAIHPLLIEAMQKEAELIHGKPFEKELKHLESMWNTRTDHMDMIHDSRHIPRSDRHADDNSAEMAMVSPPATATADMAGDNGLCTEGNPSSDSSESHNVGALLELDAKPFPDSMKIRDSISKLIYQEHLDALNDNAATAPTPISPGRMQVEPLTPPRSEKELGPQLTEGGIPWYLEGFNPSGITVHDEIYDGLKVRREMSEELSEMDDEELKGLGVHDHAADGGIEGALGLRGGSTSPVKALSSNKKKRRWRGYR